MRHPDWWALDVTAPFTDNIDLWQQKIVNLPSSLFLGGGNSNLFQVIIRSTTGLKPEIKVEIGIAFLDKNP